ncbi:hypothetical protein [Streptomyces flavidovirens]|uniref:hypothetical protein n=1 Tax=Streptomyces flavidovirens TaxID=67298 RepID=UPI00368EA565
MPADSRREARHHLTDGVLVSGGDVQDHQARFGDVLCVDAHDACDDMARRAVRRLPGDRSDE